MAPNDHYYLLSLLFIAPLLPYILLLGLLIAASITSAIGARVKLLGASRCSEEFFGGGDLQVTI